MGENQPPGYVLDVGKDSKGNWFVIEANAAWSSKIHHAPATVSSHRSCLPGTWPRPLGMDAG
jgi:hypothetical protein